MSNNDATYDHKPRDRHRITIRLARDDDAAALRRLAHLDSSPLPPQPFLLAEVDGRLLGAISLASGETIADPFSRTAELRPLLALRAAQLRGPVNATDRGAAGTLRAALGAIAGSGRLVRAAVSRAAAG